MPTLDHITQTPAEDLLDPLEGAVIAKSFVEDQNGLHICLKDGRILLICGYFAVSVIKSEDLH
jgi:hypothetical protein